MLGHWPLGEAIKVGRTALLNDAELLLNCGGDGAAWLGDRLVRVRALPSGLMVFHGPPVTGNSSLDRYCSTVSSLYSGHY